MAAITFLISVNLFCKEKLYFALTHLLLGDEDDRCEGPQEAGVYGEPTRAETSPPTAEHPCTESLPTGTIPRGSEDSTDLLVY